MLGDTIAGALPLLRSQAESLMRDACTVTRVTGTTAGTLPGSRVDVTATVYAGKCRVQSREGQEANPEVAGFVSTVQRYQVHVPVGSFRPAVGDVVTVTSAAHDPYLVDREFRVVGLLHKSMATAYRLSVEEVSGG